MTLTIQEAKTLDVELPLYRKDDCHAYKVIDQNKCICICHGSASLYIQKAHAELAWNSDETKDCTKEEFDILYDAVLNRLNTLKEVDELELELNGR